MIWIEFPVTLVDDKQFRRFSQKKKSASRRPFFSMARAALAIVFFNACGCRAAEEKQITAVRQNWNMSLILQSLM